MIAAIEGRSDDVCYFVSHDGSRRAFFPDTIRRMILLASPDILDYQAFQERDGQLRIHLAVAPAASFDAVSAAVRASAAATVASYGCQPPIVQVEAGAVAHGGRRKTEESTTSMKIAILAIGSRGDVQPFVALGCALQARGHQVVIAAAGDYEALVTAYGLPFALVGGYVRELMDFERVYAMLDGAYNPVSFALRFLAEIDPLLERIMADCWQASQGADLIVAATLGLYPGLSIAEALGVPLVAAHMHPLFATGSVPNVNFPPAPGWLPGRQGYHRLTHLLGAHGLWQLLRRPLNRARGKVLGLAPLTALELARRVQQGWALTIFGYSALIAPPPPDAPPGLHLTGFWRLPLPPAWQPDASLVEFLAAGPPPVYIGFGSNLVGRNPEQMTALCLAALAQAGQRGLLYPGWGDFATGPLPDSVLRVEATPHRWLFPRVAAVVHHGGAGTTAAALEAGAPQVIVPFLGDQSLWGEHVHALGIGPPPMPRRRLTVAALAAAIRQTVEDPLMRRQAGVLQWQLLGEDGVERAVGLIEYSRFNLSRLRESP